MNHGRQVPQSDLSAPGPAWPDVDDQEMSGDEAAGLAEEAPINPANACLVRAMDYSGDQYEVMVESDTGHFCALRRIIRDLERQYQPGFTARFKAFRGTIQDVGSIKKLLYCPHDGTTTTEVVTRPSGRQVRVRTEYLDLCEDIEALLAAGSSTARRSFLEFLRNECEREECEQLRILSHARQINTPGTANVRARGTFMLTPFDNSNPAFSDFILTYT